MENSIKCNQGTISVGEFDSEGETSVTIMTANEWSTVYLDRRRAELLIEAIKKAHNL